MSEAGGISGTHVAVSQHRQRWPSRAKLQNLPMGTIEAIEAAAAEVIHRRFVPRWRLQWRIISQRKLTTTRFASKELSVVSSLQRLTGVAPFNSWSSETLSKFLAAASKRSLERGSIVTYRGTPPAGVDVLFMLHGAAEVVDESTHRESVTGPAVLNAFVAAEGSCATSTSRVTSLTDCFCINSQRFRELFKELPSSLVFPLQQSCFESRRALHSERVFDPRLLTHSQLFSALSEGEAGEVAQRFVPCCFRNGEVVYRANCRVGNIYVLHSGVILPAENASKALCSAREFIGEVECLFGLRWRSKTVSAGPLTEGWRLPVTELQRLCGSEGPYAARVRQTLRNSRECAAASSSHVAQQRRDFVRKIPLFSWCLLPSQLNAMADTIFHSRCFLPDETLCCRAAPCDALFVILQGSCRVVVHGRPFPMDVGIWGGYPLLCRHSWAHSVMSAGVVDVAWAPRSDVVAFLHSKAPVETKEITRWSSVTLHPSQHPPRDAMQLAEYIERNVPVLQRKTVALYMTDAVGEKMADLAKPRRPHCTAQTKAIADALSPSRALPASVLTGRTTAFFRTPLGITAHTTVFTAKRWIPHSVMETPKPVAPPHAAPQGSFRARSASLQRPNVAEETIASHKAKVDRLWLSLPLSLRCQVSRLYPPMRRRPTFRLSTVSTRSSTSFTDDASNWASIRGQDGAPAHKFFEAVAAFRHKLSSKALGY